MLANYDNFTEIKEEIIEINLEKQIITNYYVIMEKAQKTINNIIDIWINN